MPGRSLPMFPIAVGLLSTALPALAAYGPTCGERATIIDRLGAEFEEATVAAGVDNGGRLVEVLASNDGATWTILVTMPEGPTCLVAAGESWQERDETAMNGPHI